MWHRTRPLRTLGLLPILLAALAPLTATASDAPDEASTESVGMVMVRVPAGEYIVGSTPEQLAAAHALCDAERRATECPKDFARYEAAYATVELEAFYIDTFEVTVDAYAACVEAGGCEAPDLDACVGVPFMKNWSHDDRGAYPMTCVTWFEARAYCEWADKRLPTADEWEAAARGADGRAYPWGDAAPAEAGLVGNFADETIHEKNADWPSIADYDDDYLVTAPVGSFPLGISPFGAHDMAGNAAEWATDESLDGFTSVVRGGTHIGASAQVRAALRPQADPSLAGGDVGFRCARSAP